MYVAALYDLSHLKLFILLDELRWTVFYQSETEYYFIMVNFGKAFFPLPKTIYFQGFTMMADDSAQLGV